MHQLGTASIFDQARLGMQLMGCCSDFCVVCRYSGVGSCGWAVSLANAFLAGKGCCGVALVIWLAIRLHTAIEYVGMFGKISDALGTVLGAALVIVLIACGASTGAIGCHSH